MGRYARTRLDRRCRHARPSRNTKAHATCTWASELGRAEPASTLNVWDKRLICKFIRRVPTYTSTGPVVCVWGNRNIAHLEPGVQGAIGHPLTRNTLFYLRLSIIN